MTSQPIVGLHHVTAICGDAQRNYQFYTEVMGLRLLKKTVNYDDPGTYHLYYGDALGTPGSILTFFPWSNVPEVREGTGLVSATAFATSEAGLAYWEKRLVENNVVVRGPMERLGEVYLEFEDPDGLRLEITVADQPRAFQPWANSPVPAQMQLRGLHSVTLSEAGFELTQALLTHQMGWTLLKEGSGRFRYQPSVPAPASFVDITCQPAGRHGLQGIGAVHHIAFRVAETTALPEWRAKLVQLGYNLSPIKDRTYFRSIYYREPGGILFELATDAPGFGVDESLATLGSKLKLPSQYEARRDQIEKSLPPLTVGKTAGS